MIWIVIAAILGGIVVGFMAGASPAPTGGNVAAAVSAMILGVFAFKSDRPSTLSTATVGMLFVLFLIALLISYISTNVLRKNEKLRWMGIGGPR
ncbi:MAG: hypothetical protein PHP93_00650 [Kiritimatiellales bacterium]|nr:hypothetical protein [Kiritimatiellales bacterium]